MDTKKWKHIISFVLVLTSIMGYGFALDSQKNLSSPAEKDAAKQRPPLMNDDPKKTENVLTIPLIPYHLQRRRRGLSENKDLSTRRNNNRYHRRFLGEGETTPIDSNPEQLSALYQGYGTHYVDLWCGSPHPQRQTLIVDTGSGKTAFPCSECDDCGSPQHHIDPYFQEQESTTFRSMTCQNCTQRATCQISRNRCTFGQSYSEGSSWEAYEAIDTCYLGGFHNAPLLEKEGSPSSKKHDSMDPRNAVDFGFPLRFGCQTMVTGLFQTQLADGILGMTDGKNAFWHQMYRAHKLKSKQFSLCFSRPGHPTREGTEAGAITLGGTNSRLHSSPMVYTTTIGTPSELPRTKKSGYFDVYVRNVYLRDGKAGGAVMSEDSSAIVLELTNAEDINGEDGGVIVDSGTTDTFFSRVLQHTLERNWKTLVKEDMSHDKVTLNPSKLAKLPTILIQMAGDEELNRAIAKEHGGAEKVPGLAANLDPDHPLDVVIAVPPSHYMENLASGKFQNRIYANEEDGSVLGANTMMGHDVLFDPKHSRIGWAESSCDYSELVTTIHGYPSVMGEISGTSSKVDTQQEEKQELKQDEWKEVLEKEQTENEIQQQENQIEQEGPTKEDPTNSNAGTSVVIEDSANDPTKEAFDPETVRAEDPSSDDIDKDIDFSRENVVPPRVDNGDNVNSLELDDIKKQIADNPTIASGGILFLILLSCFICFFVCRCFCGPRRKKPYRRIEVEMNNTTGQTYRDEFHDEQNDDAEEYGEYKDV